MKIELDIPAQTFIDFMDHLAEAEWDQWPEHVQEVFHYLSDIEYRNAKYIIKNKLEK